MLKNIYNEIANDIERGKSNNDYIKDENGSKLINAVEEISRSGVYGGSLKNKIENLMWFVGGNSQQILSLQRNLNALGITGKHGKLKEDGVYGEETLSAWETLIKNLERGIVPTLSWIDVLQTNKTGISVGVTRSGQLYGIKNAFVYKKKPYIRFDPSHNGQIGYFRGQKMPINYKHVNFEKVNNSNFIYEQIRMRYNHYPLSDEAYNVLKNLDDTGKKVRIGGRVLFVTGIVLDTLELGKSINDDLNDADKKIGKKTLTSVFSIGGSWAGAAIGAKIGASVGAFTGPAAPIAIPVLSLVGGIAGSFVGDSLGSYVVDITYVGE